MIINDIDSIANDESYESDDEAGAVDYGRLVLSSQSLTDTFPPPAQISSPLDSSSNSSKTAS